MIDNIVKFPPPESVGEGYRTDPDELLEGAKGKSFETIIIIGQRKDGTLSISSNANLGETVVLMEFARHDILFGDRP